MWFKNVIMFSVTYNNETKDEGGTGSSPSESLCSDREGRCADLLTSWKLACTCLTDFTETEGDK